MNSIDEREEALYNYYDMAAAFAQGGQEAMNYLMDLVGESQHSGQIFALSHPATEIDQAIIQAKFLKFMKEMKK